VSDKACIDFGGQRNSWILELEPLPRILYITFQSFGYIINPKRRRKKITDLFPTNF
jgi:hypothetical protein